LNDTERAPRLATVAEPPLRADARRNRDRVLRAATEAFAEAGFGVPLDAIAARAGVGPGTVYRHFPTKEALFQAVVTARLEDLIAEARRLADVDDAGAALRTFLARMRQEAATKGDASDAIAVPGPLQAELHSALAVLLSRAQQAGAARTDLGVDDLIAMLKGMIVAVRDHPTPQRVERVFAVLADGLLPR
jgi:AcrR family transcriptional regulator